MTGKNGLPRHSVAERLQYQAEFENLAAAEVRRIVDAFIQDRGVTQTEIANSVGLDPSRLSKALYPSNVTLRTLSLIALACDQEWALEARSLDEVHTRHLSNYSPQPMVGPDESYGEAAYCRTADRTSMVPEFVSGSALSGDKTSNVAELRQ